MSARRLFGWITAVMLGLGPAAPAFAGESDGLPSARSFFRHPDLGAAKLSPNGRWIAVTSAAGAGRLVLSVLDLERKVEPAVVAAFTDADVDDFYWVSDRRLVFVVLDRQRGGGDQNFGSGLFGVERDGSNFQTLIAALGLRGIQSRTSVGNGGFGRDHSLLWVPSDSEDEIIIGHYKFDALGDVEHVNPLRLNLAKGSSRSLATGAPEGARRWLFAPDGEPRVITRTFRGDQEVLWRGPGEQSWRSLVRQPVNSSEFIPIAVDSSGQLFVTTSGPKGVNVLRRFDFATGRPEAEALVSAPGFDFRGGVITDRAARRALGVRVHTDAETTVWFDPHMRKVQALADARFPGRVNRLSCHSCAPDANVLLFSAADQDPGSYWVYRSSTDEWESVGKRRRDIDPRRMAQMDFHRIRSRDGHDLPVWMTTPTSKPTAPRPAVVLVHGGPWVRGGFWNWDADAQFLASRGYVVIEPEFRGSLGYGFDHFKRGWKQWGTAMQDDVADAVQWAVDKGLVDEKRVCIAGASYGGYSTLMSLVRYPDRYRCGVAWVAVSDPRLLMANVWRSDIPQEARRWTLPEIIGDPEKDADMLKAATPSERAKEIKAPLLMAFGREDRRVPLEHGIRMRDAMRAAGQSPEWIVYDDEAHGWLKVDNRVDFWQRVERFLDKHLR